MLRISGYRKSPSPVKGGNMRLHTPWNSLTLSVAYAGRSLGDTSDMYFLNTSYSNICIIRTSGVEIKQVNATASIDRSSKSLGFHSGN